MPKSSTSPKTSGKAEIRPARIAKALLAEMEKDRAEQERISRRTEKLKSGSDGNYNQDIGGIMPFPFRRKKPQGNVLKLDSASPMTKPVDSGIDIDGDDDTGVRSGRQELSGNGPDETESADWDDTEDQEPSAPADDVISQAEELRRDRQEAQARKQDNPDETDEAYGDWGGNLMGRNMDETQSMAEEYGDNTDETDDAYGDWDGNVSDNSMDDNINQQQNQDRNSQAQSMAMQMAKNYAKQYAKKVVIGWLAAAFIAALPYIIVGLIILLVVTFICIIGYYAYNHPLGGRLACLLGQFRYHT